MSKQYETVIGLEVHVELATRTKIFCGCSTAFGGAPNTHTCPVCTGMPGSLPVLNKKVVDYALRVGLAANCKINQLCKFDRKNYFYPDNPQNYQISQLSPSSWISTILSQYPAEHGIFFSRSATSYSPQKCIGKMRFASTSFTKSSIPR